MDDSTGGSSTGAGAQPWFSVEVQGHGRSKARLPWGYSINGHATGTDLLEVPIPYIRPMFQAYVREYPNKIWPKIWY